MALVQEQLPGLAKFLIPDLAEVDGNRTRRTGIARPTRFEGGGAHQVLGHLLGIVSLPPGPLACLPLPP